MAETYTIHLPKFEGPFDLLLFFIERDELDIYDIPIAKVTDDFLQYMYTHKSLNLDLASEFIVVAATLMRIKAKMLLPRKQLDEQGVPIDPRGELVDRLLEYKRYKSVIAELQVLETGRLAREGRGGVASELQQIAVKALVDSELESFTLFKLLKIYENLINRYEEKKSRQIHQVIKYEYTIQEQQTYLLETLKRDEALDFETIYGNLDNRIHAIVTFLAMLELLNMEQIVIIQGDGINQFWLKLVSLSR
ncbi:MAG: hypothetical protein RIS64_2656 [Bacteroidota bacterium]|jgi:segregation and condensation protein A